jgi:hypothetical protein
LKGITLYIQQINANTLVFPLPAANIDNSKAKDDSGTAQA